VPKNSVSFSLFDLNYVVVPFPLMPRIPPVTFDTLPGSIKIRLDNDNEGSSSNNLTNAFIGKTKRRKNSFFTKTLRYQYLHSILLSTAFVCFPLVLCWICFSTIAFYTYHFYEKCGMQDWKLFIYCVSNHFDLDTINPHFWYSILPVR
jgi:hypothetical protein